jgi:hypothetical protein
MKRLEFIFQFGTTALLLFHRATDSPNLAGASMSPEVGLRPAR